VPDCDALNDIHEFEIDPTTVVSIVTVTVVAVRFGVSTGLPMIDRDCEAVLDEVIGIQETELQIVLTSGCREVGIDITCETVKRGNPVTRVEERVASPVKSGRSTK